jgi:hypothetical protein
VLDFEDEITRETCVTHDGKVVNERAQKMIEPTTKEKVS